MAEIIDVYGFNGQLDGSGDAITTGEEKPHDGIQISGASDGFRRAIVIPHDAVRCHEPLIFGRVFDVAPPSKDERGYKVAVFGSRGEK